MLLSSQMIFLSFVIGRAYSRQLLSNHSNHPYRNNTTKSRGAGRTSALDNSSQIRNAEDPCSTRGRDMHIFFPEFPHFLVLLKANSQTPPSPAVHGAHPFDSGTGHNSVEGFLFLFGICFSRLEMIAIQPTLINQDIKSRCAGCTSAAVKGKRLNIMRNNPVRLGGGT